MNKVARILCTRYLSENNGHTIGGVQSYVESLISVFIELGYDVILYQFSAPLSNETFQINKDGYTIIGVKNAKKTKDLLDFIVKHHNPDYENDFLVFSTDYMIEKNQYKKSVAIQHGIAWDITKDEYASDIYNYYFILKAMLRTIKKFRKYKYCNNLVCVDYNFVNWYRTQIAYIKNDLYVIPNYARCLEKVKKKNCSMPSIVFARRLVDYRGTKLFVRAITNLLIKHPDIKVTIAGTGPDEAWMREKLLEFSQVEFTKYEALDSIEFHSKFDIAIVPSTGSEGTSLSLLEAMAAGCAVVATNVGGMTNIIIDEYNGRIVRPSWLELENAIEDLLINENKRKKIAEIGKKTVEEAFSFQRWKESWSRLILQIQQE